VNSNSIVGLSTHIGALTGDGDVVSRTILLKLNHILLARNGTNKMSGDLLMYSSNNDSVSIGCTDWCRREYLWSILGNVHNGSL